MDDGESALLLPLFLLLRLLLSPSPLSAPLRAAAAAATASSRLIGGGPGVTRKMRATGC